ncbi:hypothetical protein Val02_11140 [Virgisporangium aliadipatigenens]|uniref:DUF6892 domain-containing protein n=1 Tax=Virgisporangium aliadipatigenens TaxID=741659 RepID=A0A8J3YHU8_9ACTN|nr:leucine-rich repeat domain-containing protein [Virgisporangium aliadipatigenens]GIJ44228.1 hypothetical protein Val02_11140 [Virgisporangium aliadipatigenens]
MDPVLHLALLSGGYLRDEPTTRAEALDLPVPERVRTAWWTDRATLRGLAGQDDRVRSLEGIAAFPGLSTLYLADSDVADLTPLAGLPRLELLYLNGPPDVDLTPLLDCPELKRVHFTQSLFRNPTHDVLRTLVARGVQVDSLIPGASEALEPFECDNLKLAVIDALESQVELPTTYFFDEYSYDDDNLDAVLATPVTREQLDTIEVLSWLGGGHTTTHLVWAQFDGESDEFEIESLVGIEALRNLKALRTSVELVPAEQVEALKARGVSVDEWGEPVDGEEE